MTNVKKKKKVGKWKVIKAFAIFQKDSNNIWASAVQLPIWIKRKTVFEYFQQSDMRVNIPELEVVPVEIRIKGGRKS